MKLSGIRVCIHELKLKMPTFLPIGERIKIRYFMIIIINIMESWDIVDGLKVEIICFNIISESIWRNAL